MAQNACLSIIKCTADLLSTPVVLIVFSLCRDELSEQLELKRKEKKKMRKKLKIFEDDFFEQTGR